MSQEPTNPQLTTHTESLETCIRHRHSIRAYKPDAINPDLLHESLLLAQLAPSNSNIQNWRLWIAQDAAKDRIVTALRSASEANGPEIPPLPDHFRHYRSEMGHVLYGPEGYDIARSDRAGHRAATQRNYEFFGAPVVALITMDSALTPVDAMSVGMYVQTLMLALTERGLGTCLQVSVTGYPEVLRREFGFPQDQLILCGLAIGEPAPEAKVNRIVLGRDQIDSQVTFLME